MIAYIDELKQRYPPLASCEEDILAAYDKLRASYTARSKVLICGNGGSAADAEHWSGEMLKGFLHPRPLAPTWHAKLGSELAQKLQGGLPTIPLASFTSATTAFANDADADYGFAQLVWALAQQGDTIIGISTSGNSKNVLHAIETATALGLSTIGLSGHSGGRLAELVDVCIRVPASEVHFIQEYHLPIYHCLCRMLEDHFFA